MNTTTKLALAAALFSGLAFPAFAIDQGSEQAVMVPANAYASAAWTERHHAPAHGSAHMSTISFQAQGSR